MDLTAQYLENTLKLAAYYKKLGDGALKQIKNEEINWTPDEESNSVAIIVKHLWGNMRSRWTNLLTEDGEKPWRDRDAEFVNDIASYDELIQKWNEGWMAFTDALQQLKPENLGRIIYIRNEGCTVMDAIQRQMAHYPMHVGQIIYIAKMLRKQNWTSLSIPKGASDEFNKAKFSQTKTIQHFTEKF